MKYGIPPAAVPSIDPFQLLTLEVVSQALDDAGYSDRPFNRERTSVILGASGGVGDLGFRYGIRAGLPMYLDPVPEDVLSKLPEWTEDSFAGVLLNVAAGRVANRLNLGGLNFTVDAACASSLAAVYIAARELESGASDMVIVGGIDTVNSPFGYLCFSSAQALSPTGRCRTFDETADGIAISEGLVSLVLKRVDDAERDGDRIYAVIKAVAGSSDGRGKGLTAPKPEGQMRVLERAYAAAGILARHRRPGRGARHRHSRGRRRGSDGADACVRRRGRRGRIVRARIDQVDDRPHEVGGRRQRPAQGGAVALSQDSAADAARDEAECQAARGRNRVLRQHGGAAVGGARRIRNSRGARPSARSASAERTFTWWSRNTIATGQVRCRRSLRSMRGLRRLPVLDQPEPAASVGRAAAVRRAAVASIRRCRCGTSPLRCAAPRVASAANPVRLAIVASSIADLASEVAHVREALQAGKTRISESRGDLSVRSDRTARQGRVPLPRTGIAVPWACTAICRSVFPISGTRSRRRIVSRRATIARRLSSYVLPPPAFSDEQRASQMRESDRHRGCATGPWARSKRDCADLLRRLGVRPDMTAGHSYGEYVALSVAGAFPADTLIMLSEARGRAIKTAAGEHPGTMAAVAASREAIAGVLGDSVERLDRQRELAEQTVLAGSTEAIDAAVAALSAAGFAARRIPVACAFHSPLVQAAARVMVERAGRHRDHAACTRRCSPTRSAAAVSGCA